MAGASQRPRLLGGGAGRVGEGGGGRGRGPAHPLDQPGRILVSQPLLQVISLRHRHKQSISLSSTHALNSDLLPGAEHDVADGLGREHTVLLMAPARTLSLAPLSSCWLVLAAALCPPKALLLLLLLLLSGGCHPYRACREPNWHAGSSDAMSTAITFRGFASEGQCSTAGRVHCLQMLNTGSGKTSQWQAKDGDRTARVRSSGAQLGTSSRSSAGPAVSAASGYRMYTRSQKAPSSAASPSPGEPAVEGMEGGDVMLMESASRRCCCSRPCLDGSTGFSGDGWDGCCTARSLTK